MQCFIMFVFGIVAFHVGNGVGGTEACQGVDMTVGIIAGQIDRDPARGLSAGGKLI